MGMIGKIQKLAAEPGFRAAPLAVLLRGAALAARAAAGQAPTFRLGEGGPWLSVPADLRYTSVTAFLLREWAEPELRHMTRFLSPGATFVDVGANIGLYALRAAPVVGRSGRVVAVEPAGVTAQRLERNLGLNDFPQVSVVRAALSDSEGEAELRHVELGDDPQAWSLMPEAGGAGGERVRTTTLDALMAAEGLGRLDLLKMDVEGAEPLVVAGGRETLRRHRPAVIFEVNAPPSLARGEARACFDALAMLGYRMHRLEPRDGIPVAVDGPGTAHGNLVALHPDGVAGA